MCQGTKIKIKISIGIRINVQGKQAGARHSRCSSGVSDIPHRQNSDFYGGIESCALHSLY